MAKAEAMARSAPQPVAAPDHAPIGAFAIGLGVFAMLTALAQRADGLGLACAAVGLVVGALGIWAASVARRSDAAAELGAGVSAAAALFELLVR